MPYIYKLIYFLAPNDLKETNPIITSSAVYVRVPYVLRAVVKRKIFRQKRVIQAAAEANLKSYLTLL
jgi:hypothetical protein